jgi:ABC-type bacteriocin/lantibiotic exporter with double-glycine peptidase domain
MVLAYYGEERGEGGISQLLGTTPAGTRTERLHRLANLGYEVVIEELLLSELEDWLAEEVPVVVWVDPTYLSSGGIAAKRHAVVVVGLSAEAVYLHDPLRDEGPTAVSRQDFRDAWTATGFEAAMITR